MKRLFLIAIAFVCAAFGADAQTILSPLDTIPDGYAVRDSLVYVQVARYQENLHGKNILDLMGDDVNISQSPEVAAALKSSIQANRSKTVEGYRIRIFLDNKQDSREKSLQAEEAFKAKFPGYNTYRSFNNPFFKVTVGDFRTKADAQIALRRIARQFPAAFVVKEKMRYPVIDTDKAVRVDTLRVLYKIETPETK